MKEKLFVVTMLVMVGVLAMGGQALDALAQDQGASSTDVLVADSPRYVLPSGSWAAGVREKGAASSQPALAADSPRYVLPSGSWAAGVREKGAASFQLALAADSPRYVLPSGSWAAGSQVARTADGPRSALTSGVDPDGPVHGGGYLSAGAADAHALTSGVDPDGPVHGGGYLSAGAADTHALTSGVDPRGPIHGGGYAASAAPELFALTAGVNPMGPVHGGGFASGVSEGYALPSGKWAAGSQVARAEDDPRYVLPSGEWAAGSQVAFAADGPRYVLPSGKWAAGVGERGTASSDPLVIVRRSTANYHRIEIAEEEGFVPLFDCIANPSDAAQGAMGVHYIQPSRFDDQLALDEPEVLVYEPQANGRMRLVAVEYVVPAAAWTEETEPPEFLGQELKYKTTIGRYGTEDGIDPYFEVHAWVWKHNSGGMFADWNPNVTCSN